MEYDKDKKSAYAVEYLCVLCGFYIRENERKS